MSEERLINSIIRIIALAHKVPFESVEKNLRSAWTKGEIRNAIWYLAHKKQIEITSNYTLSIRKD